MRKEIVFLLEERSAKVLLEQLLPRVLDDRIDFKLIAFEGKQDLEKRMVMKLQGYLNPEARFIVMRDQDSDPDCKGLKEKLAKKCNESGKGAKTLVRIACRELETFYLADLSAVEKAFKLKGLAEKQNSAKYRKPDYLVSPSHELRMITKQHYEKISGSRELGRLLDLDNSRSDSFKNLIEGIKRLEQELLGL